MALHALNQYLLESKTDINYKSIDYLVMGEVVERVTGLVLVDHNKLSGSWDQYGDKVAVILDHHRDENLYPHAG